MFGGGEPENRGLSPIIYAPDAAMPAPKMMVSI